MRGKTLTAALVGLITAGGVALPPLTTTAEAVTVATARSAAPAFKVTPISWKKCKDDRLRKAKAKCGLLTVPLDHANPTGPTIQIAVSRILHTKKQFKGAVFTNPGGPGGSGLIYSVLGQYVPHGVGQSYDWYGIDPRGIGDSVPALSCDKSYYKPGSLPYEPTTQANLDFWVAKAQKYAADCAAAPAAALLPHMRTTDTVADMELLRQSIGLTQITWYGFSYGTEIGQVYATQHPTSIKAMILDGVVDANQNWFDTGDDQIRAFSKSFDTFYAWVASYDKQYHLGRSAKIVERKVTRIAKSLARKPVGRTGAPEFEAVVLGAGYYNGTWPDVASIVASTLAGDITPLRKAYRDSYPPGKDADNGQAAFLATSCTDSPWPADLQSWLVAGQKSAEETSPYESWNNWFNSLACRTWPVAADPKIFQVSGAQLTAPVLLTSETYDGATPFAGALATRALFPTSVLIEGKGGSSHAVSLSGVSCTDDAIAQLLKNGSLPARKAGERSDKKCPPLGAPVLGAEDADRASAAKVLARSVSRSAFPG